jgi:hypothetical protein
MTWIGLRDSCDGQLCAAGIGSLAQTPPVDPDRLLSRGTLLWEFDHVQATTRQNILRYASRDPWPSGLTLCIDPDGTLQVLMVQGARSLAFRLPTTGLGAQDRVAVAYAWNAPLRQGVISLQVASRRQYFQTEVADPIPLSMRDAKQMFIDDRYCKLAANLRYVALSDRVEPAGLVSGIGSNAHVDTPDGPQLMHSLRPGAVVLTADGDRALVRWTGSQVVPARGQFAPLLARAPYFGLTQDLLIAPSQRLQLTGSRVEYLFGEEKVSALARHLVDGRAIIAASGLDVVRYHQIVLDRPAILRFSGAAMASMDLDFLHIDRRFQRHSILSEMPTALLPELPVNPLPVLRDFEAMTLASEHAA